VSSYRHLVEDGVVVGNRAPKQRAIPGEAPEKRVPDGFDLHVVAKHTLAGIPIVQGGRQERFKLDAHGETRPSVGADGEMCREYREGAGWWHAVTRIVKDANGSVPGNRHGWNGSVHRPHGDLGRGRRNRKHTPAGGGQPFHEQLIDTADKRAVNIDHIARFGVDRRVIDTTQQRVDPAELGRRLRAGGSGDDGWYQKPCQAAIDGAVDPVVDGGEAPPLWPAAGICCRLRR
jgi:hypothetical protein